MKASCFSVPGAVFVLAIAYVVSITTISFARSGRDAPVQPSLEDFRSASRQVLQDATLLKVRVFDSVDDKLSDAVRGLFDSLDKDGDGVISRAEFEGMTLSTWAVWHAFSGSLAHGRVPGFSSLDLRLPSLDYAPWIAAARERVVAGMSWGTARALNHPMRDASWGHLFFSYCELLLLVHCCLVALENLRHLLGLPRSGWRWPTPAEQKKPRDVPRLSKAAVTEFTTPLQGYELWKTLVMTLTGFAPFKLFMFAGCIVLGVLLINVAAVVPSARWRNFWLRGPVRCACFAALTFLGYYCVSVRGAPAPPARCKLLLANHVGAVEILVLFGLAFPSFVSAVENTRLPLFSGVCRALDAVLVDRWDPDSKKKTLEEIKQRASDRSASAPQLMIFPEGTVSNQAGLFRFNRGAFAAGEPVQLVAFRMPYRHFNPCYTGRPVGGCELGDLLFRSCCQLVQRMEVCFLPVHEPTAAEKRDPLLFANQSQLRMASVLGCGVSDASYHSWKAIEARYKQLKLEAQAERRRRREARRRRRRAGEAGPPAGDDDGEGEEGGWWNPFTACGVCAGGLGGGRHRDGIRFDRAALEALFAAEETRAAGRGGEGAQGAGAHPTARAARPRAPSTPRRARASRAPSESPAGLIPTLVPQGHGQRFDA
jgi:1-acyl-sn-glycerol-3-phosphate acyltransferase